MEKHGDDNKVRLLKRKGRVKNSHWALKATIITFFTSAFFSFVAESTESNGNLIVIVVLLLFLIVGNVVFDGIGIAAATADETEVKRLSKHCGRSEKNRDIHCRKRGYRVERLQRRNRRYLRNIVGRMHRRDHGKRNERA